MAKRKRLSPAQTGHFGAGAAPEVKSMEFPPVKGPLSTAPIAQVAGEASAAAALAEVSQTLGAARAEGRMIEALPLDRVEEGYLLRDRMATDEEELQALMESLRRRGQQTPIEVVELGQGSYGLISGWRRLSALRRLHADTGEARFGRVLAICRRPEGLPEAYVAMVEENEIRVGLSYFERARVVARAVEQGVFPDERGALRSLFAAASRAKRSKIGSFLTVVRRLDGVLAHPARLSERLGLRLARALDADAGLAGRLQADLQRARPATAEEEQERIERLLAAPADRQAGDRAAPAAGDAGPGDPRDRAAPAPGPQKLRVRLSGEGRARRLTVEGPGVDETLRRDLEHWLLSR